MADIHSATDEIRRGKEEERKKERKKEGKKERRNHRAKYNGVPYSIWRP